MSAALALTSYARGDLAECRLWYEQRRAGLGDEFAAEFYAALEAIAQAPTAQVPFHGAFRRRKLRRFPHLVVFHAEAERILILAVIHVRRSDEFVQDQITRHQT